METDKILDIDKLLDIAVNIYEERIAFNRLIGVRVESITLSKAALGFNMRDDLIGNYLQNILHGGVISAVLDATGGMLVSVGVLNQMIGATRQEMSDRLARIGTIDLRIDYLRPGRGRHFISSSSMMRSGRKVAVTRMELHNDQDLLIAVGTGTYIIG